jgi:putative ABC transport system permease protein
VLLASWLVHTVIALIGSAVPRLTETTLDLRVLGVTIAVSIATALLFGGGPAVSLAFTNVQEVLKEGGRSVSASRRVLLTGRAMVALQVGLTVVLLACAGLMFKSIWQMTSYPPGLAPDQILTMRVDFRGQQYREQSARHDYVKRLLAQARGLPPVREAAVTTAGQGNLMLVVKEGEPMPENRADRTSAVSAVSVGFGPLIGMSLVRGRWFSEIETPGAVILNESLVRTVFGDADPINTRIRVPWFGPERYGTIVGVVRDLKYTAIDADPTPEVFLHYEESPLSGVTVALRLDGDPVAMAPVIRKHLAAVDPTQSLFAVKTMEAALSDSIAPRRFNLLLLGSFALVAVALAVIGVYGVVAYAVAERTQEIGIRLALGADRARVVHMIVRQGMWGVMAGLLGGLAGAWAATRLMSSLLYGVQPHDLATFATITIALVAIAFMACAVPALKAAFVDPVVALRAE